MDIYSAALIFVVFCLGLYVENRRGFREGAQGGHVVGVYETVEFLSEMGHLNATNETTERPATVAEMTAFVLARVGERRVIKTEQIEA